MPHIPQELNLSPAIKFIKINSNFSSVFSTTRIWIQMSILKKRNNEEEKSEKNQRKVIIVKMLALTFIIILNTAFSG